MMRDIQLQGEWWKECIGPLLGYAKDGHLIALTPTKSGLGYQYRRQDGTIQRVGHRELEEALKPCAITFTKALPLKPLRVKDLLRFTWSVVSGPNALLLVLCALVVVLLGMFLPMANKLIFDTVIPTGDASGLLPITGLLFGATISTLLLTLTRNLYILRIRNNAELHVQNAVMARTFLLSPTFFSKNPSGELSEKLNNVTTLAGLINEAAVGALLNAILNIIYLTQVYIYGGKLFWPAVAVIFIQYAVLLLNYRRAVNVREKYTGRAAKLSGLEYNLFAGIQKLKLTGSENRAFARWLSTIRHCDRIIVLDKGKIAEEGTFEELMEKKGLFYEMSLRQL